MSPAKLTVKRGPATSRKAFPGPPSSVDRVTDELQNPISAALSVADLLLDREGSGLSPEARNDLDRVVCLLGRSDRMVRNLVRVLRIVWEPEEWSAVDLGEIVDRLRETFDALAADRAATIVTGSLPAVWGQARKLEQALSNLVENALQHLPASGGTVRVDAKVDGTFVTLRVSDNGSGIAGRYLTHLFQLYARVPKAGAGHGPGVGLAIVRRVVQEHGGRMWVESEVGAGSSFFVQLPNVVQPS